MNLRSYIEADFDKYLKHRKMPEGLRIAISKSDKRTQFINNLTDQAAKIDNLDRKGIEKFVIGTAELFLNTITVYCEDKGKSMLERHRIQAEQLKNKQLEDEVKASIDKVVTTTSELKDGNVEEVQVEETWATD